MSVIDEIEAARGAFIEVEEYRRKTNLPMTTRAICNELRRSVAQRNQLRLEYEAFLRLQMNELGAPSLGKRARAIRRRLRQLLTKK